MQAATGVLQGTALSAETSRAWPWASKHAEELFPLALCRFITSLMRLQGYKEEVDEDSKRDGVGKGQ